MKSFLCACVLCLFITVPERAVGNLITESKYEILSNGDSVCYIVGKSYSDTLIFLKDVPLYELEKKRESKMEYSTTASNFFQTRVLDYEYHVKRYHAVLTNFCIQLLTYEERQALLDRESGFCFFCAVDANGRVCSIPRFVLPKDMTEVFTPERLYELSRLVKNNAMFPPPPASMTFASMFLIIYVNVRFLEEGVFHEANLYR